MNKNVILLNIKGVIMVDYLEEILGVRVKIERWSEQSNLPIFLQNKKEYYVVGINQERCLIVKILSDEFSLPGFQKQKLQLRKYTDMYIVLWLDSITSYQRQSLIKNQISFIVPGSQLYIPAMGMSLKDSYQHKVLKVERLTAMAQFILLYMIYHPQIASYSQVELGARLGISAMNISRGVQELRALALVYSENRGRSKLVQPVSYGKDLYELSKEYLQSPVQKRIYVEYEEAYLDFPVAGEEALARRTMLNPPRHQIRALDKKKMQIIPEEAKVDPHWVMNGKYIEVELWKYNPDVLVRDGMVDVISLAVSMQDIEDERIEEQIIEMMEEYKW